MKIAISGLSGVGTSSTAKLVSEREKIPVVGFTMRQLAKEKGIPFEKLQEMTKETWDFDLELDKRLIDAISEHDDCIVATDLACWLDNPRVYTKVGLEAGPDYDLKIWLDSPLEERARRIQEREGGEISEVEHYHNQRDLDNRERYIKLYGVDIFDHQDIDWIFTTTHIPLHEVAEKISQRIETLK